MSRHVLTFAIALLAVFSSLSSAHPHVFADVTVKALFSEKGFVGIKNHWVYDEMYSAAMMSSADKDKDGKLSSSENSWMQSAILEPIEKNNYFKYHKNDPVEKRLHRIHLSSRDSARTPMQWSRENEALGFSRFAHGPNVGRIAEKQFSPQHDIKQDIRVEEEFRRHVHSAPEEGYRAQTANPIP